jgi:hypothetical protein
MQVGQGDRIHVPYSSFKTEQGTWQYMCTEYLSHQPHKMLVAYRVYSLNRR